MSPRLDSQWGGSFPLPVREFHPLEAPSLAWRAELANVVQLSPRHFSRLFRNSFGTTPYRYVVGE